MPNRGNDELAATMGMAHRGAYIYNNIRYRVPDAGENVSMALITRQTTAHPGQGQSLAYHHPHQAAFSQKASVSLP